MRRGFGQGGTRRRLGLGADADRISERPKRLEPAGPRAGAVSSERNVSARLRLEGSGAAVRGRAGPRARDQREQPAAGQVADYTGNLEPPKGRQVSRLQPGARSIARQVPGSDRRAIGTTNRWDARIEPTRKERSRNERNGRLGRCGNGARSEGRESEMVASRIGPVALNGLTRTVRGRDASEGGDSVKRLRAASGRQNERASDSGRRASRPTARANEQGLKHVATENPQGIGSIKEFAAGPLHFG